MSWERFCRCSSQLEEMTQLQIDIQGRNPTNLGSVFRAVTEGRGSNLADLGCQGLLTEIVG